MARIYMATSAGNSPDFKDDGYTSICGNASTGTFVGCSKRYGRMVMGARTLEFKLCPDCDRKVRTNKGKLEKEKVRV